MKLYIYGPVQLDCFDSWQVITKAGRVVATFNTRKEATAFVRKESATLARKPLTNNFKSCYTVETKLKIT